jgi:carboxylesterase type B
MNNVDIGGTREYIDVHNTRYELQVFRGIPYAEPPTGDRRFKPPVEKAAFKTSFNATKFGDACMQNPVGINTASDVLAHKKMSEDCLHLNIYVYALVSGSKKTVMVYFHGGAWMVGSGMRHDGSALAAYGDVIVVTLNFRLGAFGYLSTGDANARGNYGTMDQMLALDWVRENIGYFGGDPGAITLFGGSAGSYDVTLHAMLQKSDARFPIKRCISSSGSLITQSPLTKTFLRNPRPSAASLAARLGCNTRENQELNDTKLLIECLRNKPVTDIIKASNFYLLDSPHFEFLWTPIQDGDLIKGRPSELFIKDMDVFSGFKSIDLLIGSNSGDGDIVFALMVRKGRLATMGIKAPNFDVPKEQLKKLIYLMFEDWPNHEGVAKAAQHEFIPYSAITGRQGRNDLIDLFSDEVFIMPAIATARVHERMKPDSRTYMYYYDHVNSVSSSQFRPEKAGHIVEQVSLFGPFVNDLSKLPINLTGVDDQVSLAMITYWTNFAKYG